MTGLSNQVTHCALTPAQQKLWTDTRTALLWHCPAFAHIFYTMLNKDNRNKHVAIFTKDIPTAATDGSNLLLNPDMFFGWNLNERVFVIAHEILHCILNHMVLMHQSKRRGKVSYPNGKTLPYIHELMNWAMDYVINDVLVEAKVGQFPKGGLHDPKIATGKDSSLDTYAKLYKMMKPQAGGAMGPAPGGQNGFDTHLDPGTSEGKDPGQAAQDRNESEWQTACAAAAHAAKVQGKLPAGLERFFNEVLNPKVDWKDKIEALFARKVGTGSFDWRKPDRRLICRDIYAPGRSGFGAGTVVVAIDTSGSIGKPELDMFFAEMAGILEDVRPRKMVLMWCDAKVHRCDEVDEPSDLGAVRHAGAPGGGGTSFIPVFEMIAEQNLTPDTLVYLTDGQGSFPSQAPSYPVIWGSIIEASQYPFGEVVFIPKDAA